MIEADIVYQDERWKAKALEDWVQKVTLLTSTQCDVQAKKITILLADDGELQSLNSLYRNKQKPTNVLSFPAFPYFKDCSGIDVLGDIAISYDTVMLEAKEKGIVFESHFIHILLHGILHLLGYDHETDEEAEVMESKEVELLAKLGIASPYE